MAEMKVGYKQTDIGIIPADWGVKNLGNLGSFAKGAGIKKDEAQSGRLPCVRYGELYTRHHYIIRNFHSFISEEVSKKSKKLRYGDILFACSGETKEDIGKCASYLGAGPAYAGGDIIILSPHSDNPEFLGYLLNSDKVAQQKANLGQGDAVVHINAKSLSSIVVAIPKPEEQKKIAAALADVDGLIESLEQLITKKQDMKTAAMQQLLTGKKRLPGFEPTTEYQQTDVGLIPKDWELARLGDVADIDNENLSSSTPSSYEIRYISLEDVNQGNLLGFSTLQFRDAPSRARRKLKYGDVLLGTVRPNLKSHLLFIKEGSNFVCSTGFAAIRPYPHRANNEYIYSHLFSDVIERQIDKVLAGSNYPAISNSDVKSLFFPLPKIEEQKAIAAVLSDMDTEIGALEQRLVKTRSLKTGMMQELLTGKTRLIKTDKFQEAVA